MADRLSLVYLGDPNSVHLRRWAGFFAERGHQVTVLAPNDRPVLPGLHPAMSVQPFSGLPSHLSVPAIWRTRRELARAMRSLQPSVVHAHYARGPAWHAWLAGRHPYAVTVWGSDVLVTGRMTRAGRLATVRALHGADLVTAASDRLADAAVGLGARSSRLRRIQFGVDTERFRPAAANEALRDRLGIGDGAIVLSPRGLSPLYRHETVLDAFAGLSDHKALLVFLAFNVDEAYRSALEGQAERLGVRDRLRILPAQPEEALPELYRSAAAIVSIPESDGVPVTVLEAMACGIPVVASDLPGVRDWLVQAAPELLVPVGNVGATRDALRRALQLSPEQRGNLGHRLRERVVEGADRARNMRQMEAWYRELAEGRGR